MRRPAELAGIGHEIGLTAVRQDRLAGRDLLFVEVEQRAVGIDAGNAEDADIDLVAGEEALGLRAQDVAVAMAQAASGDGDLEAVA